MTTAGMTAANPIAHETLRRGDLATIATMLESQRLRTVDITTRGRALWVAEGNLIIQGVEPHMGADGVTDVNGRYAFGDVGVESLATRLNLPTAHLRNWRADKTDLFDVVAGYFLRGELNGEPSPFIAPDDRVHTLRLLMADGGADGNEVDGMVRAVLGGTYLAIDNLDTLATLTDGLAQAGITAANSKITADLTESRMVIKVAVPSIRALAADVLGGYRSPFSGQTGEDVPVVFAGLVFSNSEVGRGAWTIAPQITYEVCSNGMTITKDAFTKRHVGEQLKSDGVITWSEATQRANLDLIKHQTADAVRTYLNADYLKSKLAEIAADAAVPVKDEPEQIITKVTRHTGHQASKASILNMYLMGGQMTAGGVMQAYTAAAQTVPSGDTAYDLENKAIDAMQWVAARAG